MSRSPVREFYLRQVRNLPFVERIELLALIAADLSVEAHVTEAPSRHSVMDLQGLGKEIWNGIDAQEFVDRLRDGRSLLPNED